MAEDTPTASAPAGEERATDAETKPVVAAEAAPETSQEKEAEKEKPSGKLFPDGAIFFFCLFPPDLDWSCRLPLSSLMYRIGMHR